MYRELKLARVALPLVATEAAYSIIYLTDAAMIAPLGTYQLAALGTSLTILWTIAHFGIGYMATVNTLVAQHLSRKRYRHCGLYAWQGIWTAALCGAVAFAVLAPLAPWIFSLFGHEQAVHELEVPYFQISLLSVAPEMGAVALSAFFVATGRPGRSLVGASIAAVTNGVCNYALIWGHFGFPELGMPGSAWATVIASSAHFLYLLLSFIRTPDSRLGTRVPRLDLPAIGKLGELGVPAGLQAAVEYLSWGVILIALIGTFGTSHLAAGTILICIAQAAYLPADGIGTQVLAQVAAAHGRKKFHLARIRARHGLRLVFGYLSIVAIVLVVFRNPIMHALSTDPSVVSIGSGALFIVAFILIADAAGIVYLHCLQGVGDIVWPAAASIFSAATILLGGGTAVVLLAPEWGSLGVWGVAATYITCQSALYTFRWRGGRWTQNVLA